MRVACSSRVKRGENWEDKPNYFDVVCFGAQAENVVRFMVKGRPIAIDGRLDWREWTTDDGGRRQAVQIIAESVQFLSDGKHDGDSGHSPAVADQPVSAPLAEDDDIPF